MTSGDDIQTQGLIQELADLRSGIADKNRLLAAFEQISHATLSSLDLEQLLDTLATQVIKTGLFRSLMIALVDEATDSIVVVRSLINEGLGFNKKFGPNEEVIRPAAAVPIQSTADVVGFRYSLNDDNVTAMTARTGEMQVLDEWSDTLDQRANTRQERQGKAAFFIPVKREDRVLAVMATGSQMEDKQAVLARIESMQPLLAQIAIALEHAKLYAQVQKEIAEYENRGVLHVFRRLLCGRSVEEWCWRVRAKERGSRPSGSGAAGSGRGAPLSKSAAVARVDRSLPGTCGVGRAGGV